MVFIVISDVHGNRQAFEAVIESFPKDKDTSVLYAGDIVGYGGDPGKCIEMLCSLGARSVLGNHDAVLTGERDILSMNEYAREAIRWTERHLDPGGYEHLRSLPLVLEDGTFTMVHGTLHDPEKFMYMFREEDAARSFAFLRTGICFIGHSHVPGIFECVDGRVSRISGEKISLKRDAKYIVNAGSVGQPRDGDSRACYCVYDTGAGIIEFKRVKYDIITARRRIIDAGLPEYLGDRLLAGA